MIWMEKVRNLVFETYCINCKTKLRFTKDEVIKIVKDFSIDVDIAKLEHNYGGYGTKNVEMDIINQTGYSSGNANQILLLTTEANRCLLSEESLKNPNITQEKIKKLTTKHPDKSMAFAYCERKRSE